MPPKATYYTRGTITRELAQQLITDHGSAAGAARLILKNCRTRDGKQPSANAVRLWINEALAGDTGTTKKIYERDNIERINQIANLLEEASIPLESIGRIEPVNIRSGFHEVITKDQDGNPVVTRSRSKNVALKLSPKWEDGPDWPVVQPAKPTIVKFAAPTIIIPKGLRTEVIHPDTQGGFQRNLDSRRLDGNVESYDLEPIHDEAAIDVALQVTAAIEPDGVTHVGDLLDNSEFSKYLQVEEFWRTTQASIDWGHTYLANLKSAAGSPRKGRKKKLRLVDGNHDWRRLAIYIQQNARAAFGLRPAMSTPADWPDLSFPHLLRLDELGFETCGMWPGSAAWLVESGPHALVVVHDPKRLGYFEASVISGHTHQHKEQTFSVNGPHGSRSFTHYSIGCLCSIDVRRHKGSIQRTKVPSDRGFVSNWVHGVTVVEILESTGQHQVEFVKIVDGTALFRGQVFKSNASAEKAA